MPLFMTMQDQETLRAWAAPRCGMPDNLFPDGAHALGVIDDDGAIMAVGVYIPLFDNTVECHFASNETRRWATRAILAAFCAYPFHQFTCKLLTATVNPANINVLVACLKAGWQIEGRIRRAMPDGADGIVLSMTQEDCKFFTQEAKNGKQ